MVALGWHSTLIETAARLERAGRLEEAVAVYRELLALRPELPDCWYNLGLLERRLGRFDAALESYGHALERGVSRPEEVHLNRAVIFADCLRRDAEAERELEAALALNADYRPALLNLANLHETLGRRPEARELYERMLSRWPHDADALARYAALCAQDSGGARPDALIVRVREALADPALGAAERASLGFALARLLDEKAEYPAAFAAAAAAKRASRAAAGAVAPYDRLAQERFIDELIAAFPGREVPAVAEVCGQPRPIFICGMFRSGSTLTERLLAGHPQVAAGGELDVLPRLVQSRLTPFPAAVAKTEDAALARLALEYLQQIERLFPGAARVTDKRPDNFLLIGLIRRLFPHAKIVHTTRDPLDTCLSIFFLHLDPSVSYALDLMDIGHYFRQYRRLMAHWSLLCGEDLLDFSYDALVRDPRRATQQLLAFCGLEWDENCLDFARRAGSVKTASVWQVREALHQRASGRARYYQRELGALAAFLAAP